MLYHGLEVQVIEALEHWSLVKRGEQSFVVPTKDLGTDTDLKSDRCEYCHTRKATSYYAGTVGVCRRCAYDHSVGLQPKPTERGFARLAFVIPVGLLAWLVYSLLVAVVGKVSHLF